MSSRSPRRCEPSASARALRGIALTVIRGRETFETKYRKEVERREAAERRVQATRDLLYAEERSHAATRGHLTRTKKRGGHGVCPCCNRTFQQLARHMKSKHPDYAESKS